MTLLTPQRSSIGGLLVNLVAAGAGGDTFQAGDYRLIIRNGNASACVATVVTPGVDKYGQARPDIPSVSITGTTGIGILGPFPADLEDPATGLITVTYSVTATVTVALVA